MLPKFFDIESGKLVINHNCLAIPELRAIYEGYQNSIPIFNFLYYRFDPESPYSNLPEIDKDDIIIHDFPGDYTLEDDLVREAITKLESLFVTPTYRYYLDNKVLLEKLGRFARETPVTYGRDGNVTALQSQIKSVGKTIMEFKQLEKTVLDELREHKGRTRGDKKLAYDQQ